MNDSSVLRHATPTEEVLGAFVIVYNELGDGSLVSNARQLALEGFGLQAQMELPVPVWFRGRHVGDFRCELIVIDCVILELKTAERLDGAHEAQLFNYSGATDIEAGLLLNCESKAEFKHAVFDNPRKEICVHPRMSAVGK